MTIPSRLSVRDQLAEAETRVERLRNKLSVLETYSKWMLTKGTIGEKIVAFLDAHRHLTFAPADVAVALRINSMNTVQTTMKRLVAKDKIAHWGYGNYASVDHELVVIQRQLDREKPGRREKRTR